MQRYMRRWKEIDGQSEAKLIIAELVYVVISRCLDMPNIKIDDTQLIH